MSFLKNDEFYSSLKTISGIDTLYYFYESNSNYDNLFLDILDQYEDAKGRFEKRNIAFTNSDIQISIKEQAFFFNGRDMGFYWFSHIDNFFKIGFKDCKINRSLNDIQVQFNAFGIYTLGIKNLIKYIDDLISEYITGYKPVTRIDLNIFIQADLSWIDKSMFVTRKRKFTTIFKEEANKHKVETLYIGKKPFLMRLYDKKLELKKSKKLEMMYEYFTLNGFDTQNSIYNLEFELHRDKLKEFKINTIDEVLEVAQDIFMYCIDFFRLIELDSIVDNTINAKNKNRAKTHKLWNYLSTSYKLDTFLSINAPLQRIKRKNYIYTTDKAIKEHIELAKKSYIHNISVDKQFYDEVLKAFRDSIKPKDTQIIVAKKEVYKKSIDDMTISELQKYLVEIDKDMQNEDMDLFVLIQRHKIVYQELLSRGMAEQEFPF